MALAKQRQRSFCSPSYKSLCRFQARHQAVFSLLCRIHILKAISKKIKNKVKPEIQNIFFFHHNMCESLLHLCCFSLLVGVIMSKSSDFTNKILEWDWVRNIFITQKFISRYFFLRVVRSRKSMHTHGIFCFSPHQFKFAKEGLLCLESKIFLIKSFVKRRLAVSYTSII